MQTDRQTTNKPTDRPAKPIQMHKRKRTRNMEQHIGRLRIDTRSENFRELGNTQQTYAACAADLPDSFFFAAAVLLTHQIYPDQRHMRSHSCSHYKKKRKKKLH